MVSYRKGNRMRIIDKYEDFYDYLQYVYRDSTFTFDRTGSTVISKERLLGEVTWHKSWQSYIGDWDFLLLQVGNRFWLLVLEVTSLNADLEAKDYTLHCLARWSNYNKQRRLFDLSIPLFEWKITRMLYNPKRRYSETPVFTPEYVEKQLESTLIPAINNDDYKVRSLICRQITAKKDGGWDFPILKEAGFSSCVDALDMFLAIEEYFSLEKQAAERTTSIGITDKEKIENHGFDTKISFRGKG